MSEYDFILQQLIKIVRSSELDTRSKQIITYRLIETFELTEEYIKEKQERERQKTFKKEIDD